MKSILRKCFVTFFTFIYSVVAVAQHDTTLEGHIKIVKSKYHFKTPEIADKEVCKKLESIKIPENLQFLDSEGRNMYYYLEINFYFDSKGLIIIKKKRNNNQTLNGISMEVVALLKREKWLVSKDAEYHSLKFNCNVFKTGLGKIFLSSNDNLDVVELCK
jgi:hypothetical protein